jgi:hypothetical protein
MLALNLLADKTPWMAYEVNDDMGTADEGTGGRKGLFHSANDLNHYTGVGGKQNYNHSSLKSPLSQLISSHKVVKLVSSGTAEVSSLLPTSELNNDL